MHQIRLRHQIKLKTILFLLALFSIAPAVQSAEISWNGFATISGGKTFGADKLHNFDKDPSFEENSLIGLQANADIDQQFSAVTQIIAKGKEEWDAKVEWAYISYQASSHLKVILGRQRVPFYSYSDYLDVSYAYHWIAPPEETYDTVPFNTTNGIGLIYTRQIGQLDTRLHFIYGRSTADSYVLGKPRASDITNMASLSWSAEYKNLSFRAGYSTADIDIQISDLNPLIDNWSLLSEATGNPQWNSFSDSIRADDGNDSGDFIDLALSFDHRDYFFMAEYSSLGTKGTITMEAYRSTYASFGKRFARFTPHVTYGTVNSTPTSTSFLDPARDTGIPDVDELISATENLFDNTREKRQFWVLGLKWELKPSVLFKADYKVRTNELNSSRERLVRFAVVTVF